MIQYSGTSAERDQQNASLSSAQQIWGWKTLIECHPASNMFTPRRAWFADKLNEGARAGCGGKMQKTPLVDLGLGTVEAAMMNTSEPEMMNLK